MKTYRIKHIQMKRTCTFSSIEWFKNNELLVLLFLIRIILHDERQNLMKKEEILVLEITQEM